MIREPEDLPVRTLHNNFPGHGKVVKAVLQIREARAQETVRGLFLFTGAASVLKNNRLRLTSGSGARNNRRREQR